MSFVLACVVLWLLLFYLWIRKIHGQQLYRMFLDYFSKIPSFTSFQGDLGLLTNSNSTVIISTLPQAVEMVSELDVREGKKSRRDFKVVGNSEIEILGVFFLGQ